jgi:hypothetical protein
MFIFLILHSKKVGDLLR